MFLLSLLRNNNLFRFIFNFLLLLNFTCLFIDFVLFFLLMFLYFFYWFLFFFLCYLSFLFILFGLILYLFMFNDSLFQCLLMILLFWNLFLSNFFNWNLLLLNNFLCNWFIILHFDFCILFRFNYFFSNNLFLMMINSLILGYFLNLLFFLFGLLQMLILFILFFEL